MLRNPNKSELDLNLDS